MKKLISCINLVMIIFFISCDNNAEEKNSMTEVNNNSNATASATKIEEYFKNHDTAYVAEDAVFKNMGTGEETKGRKAIDELLHNMYHVAFDAHADIKNTIVTEKQAVLEATFTGKNIGSFAGMPATNKDVKVPLCVTYDLNEQGLIKEARIYMSGDVMMQQLKDK